MSGRCAARMLAAIRWAMYILMIPFLITLGQGACASASFGTAGLANMNIRHGQLAGPIFRAICWGMGWPAHNNNRMLQYVGNVWIYVFCTDMTGLSHIRAVC